jgi:phosphopantetheinyl transferase
MAYRQQQQQQQVRSKMEFTAHRCRTLVSRAHLTVVCLIPLVLMLLHVQVQFPAKPAVSAEGRAFLSRCLAYNQEERWDVITAAADPYLQLKR